MSRLIDADALIETIENVCCKPCKELKHDCNGVKCRACQYGDEIDDIDSFHTAEQPHWIPFSERMPEVDATVLVQFCDGDMVILTFPNIYRTLERVAWMPLPEPYKEGEQE